MTNSWVTVQGNLMPEKLEITNDEAIVRKNIKEVTKKDEYTQKEITYYEYDECHMTSMEYSSYLERQQNLNDITDAQVALADLYELIEGGSI